MLDGLLQMPSQLLVAYQICEGSKRVVDNILIGCTDIDLVRVARGYHANYFVVLSMF